MYIKCFCLFVCFVFMFFSQILEQTGSTINTVHFVGYITAMETHIQMKNVRKLSFIMNFHVYKFSHANVHTILPQSSSNCAASALAWATCFHHGRGKAVKGRCRFFFPLSLVRVNLEAAHQLLQAFRVSQKHADTQESSAINPLNPSH